MRYSRTDTYDVSEFWRSLPVMLGALLSAILAVDMLLAVQPAWLGRMGQALQTAVSTQPISSRLTHVLAGSLAIGVVVISSAVLLAFMRSAVHAPQLSLSPVWVALCMFGLAVANVTPPLPMPTPVFAGLSALVTVGAGTLLWSSSRAKSVFGWVLLASPLLLVAVGHYASPRVGVGRDTAVFVTGLALSAAGVALSALVAARHDNPNELPGLEGIDVVEELYNQIERAERSEARVVELERQLQLR
ncbi:MAG: hypothetical protein OXU20_27785 [Myxococcales bacterium]|nr:hypothetical protein [Myxococcales bacterium]MDD9971725.1 hypothetical protein [Myxococcales bacterium]